MILKTQRYELSAQINCFHSFLFFISVSIAAHNMKIFISRLQTAKFADLHVVAQLPDVIEKNSFDIIISTPSTTGPSTTDDIKIFDMLVAGGQVFL